MKRREFLMVFGGTEAAWPSVIQAQPANKVHRIGFVSAIGNIGLVAYLATQADREKASGMAIRKAAQNLRISAVLAEHTAVNYEDAFALIEKERPHALIVSSQLWTWERRQIIFNTKCARFPKSTSARIGCVDSKLR
jgi:hypothetical protein